VNYVACVDLHDNHNVFVFEVSSGNIFWTDKGDSNKIFDICFSLQDGVTNFATAGSKHMKFWSVDNKTSEKGLFGKEEMTSFACVVYDEAGTCYSGGANGKIYIWKSRNVDSTLSAHKGFVSALRYYSGKIYSGGKDGVINVIDTTTLTIEKTFNVGFLVRGVDGL